MSEDYKETVTQTVIDVRKRYPLQPILFVGSGLSRRWISSPSWLELMEWLVEVCPEISRPLAFYLQQENNSMPSVASRLIEPYQSWAWGGGRSNFPDILFQSRVPKDIYLKYFIGKRIKSFGTSVAEKYIDEAKAFSEIRPHAVITTNYDELMEEVLADYQPVLERGLITAPFASIGEIYKIHGTVAKPSSIVVSSDDYEQFRIRRKYLSAKLLTFFAEHPILFVGYSVEDENVRGILHDLNEALEISGDLIPNIFHLSRPQSKSTPPLEKIIPVSSEKGVRINAIETDDFAWVFDAFGHSAPLENFNPQVLRAILARSYHLVRKDIPRQKVEVDFDLISASTSSDEQFAKLFGIANLQPATEFSAKYCFNLTEVGKKLGYPGWHGANTLLNRILEEKGVDIKASDNRYHCTVRISKKSKAQMYSQDAVNLLKVVKLGQDYILDLDEEG